MAAKDKQERKRRSGRTTALAGLLAVVALLAAWLSDCIPGFGIGAGTKQGEGEAEPQAEQAEPAEPAQPEEQPEPVEPAEPAEPAPPTPTPMKLTIDARGCLVDGADPVDCTTLCDEDARFEGVEAVVIDGKNAPYKYITDATDCLKAKGLAVALERD